MIKPELNLVGGEEYTAYYRANDTDHGIDEKTGAYRRTHYVYRYWSDLMPKGKQLLYVGFTQEFGARDAMHAFNSWWHHIVTRYDMDVYPNTTRAEARRAEARTIRSEVPLFNIHKNPQHDAVHGRQWTSENVERFYFQEVQRLMVKQREERGEPAIF